MYSNIKIYTFLLYFVNKKLRAAVSKVFIKKRRISAINPLITAKNCFITPLEAKNSTQHKPADTGTALEKPPQRIRISVVLTHYSITTHGNFHCRKSVKARLPSQKQKSIRTLSIFGAEQFKTRRFLFEQGTKSPPYCRMVRFLTQFRRKYAVLNHIGFDSPHLKAKLQSRLQLPVR